MIKRILLVTLVSSVLILSFSSCSSKSSKSSELLKVSPHVQSQSVYDKSMSSSKKLTTSFKISPTNKSFPDDYAGSYIDSKGLFHVNLVSNKNLETYKSIVNNDSVIFSLQKTSLNTLHNIHVLLEDYMTKYKMTAIATMEQTDTVDIRLKDINDEAAILNIVTKAGYNRNCIKFDVNAKGIPAL
ncbi:hypothetical protein [Clostridium estertheticum]|uniref:hypothetical protein n=1 Tax=Clostridium estertheticum TaxID=238834 RepID=UPI001CF40A4B|nr:hypothetical protein [Clostridium estertheticum]MCB2356746.1 hypothetical protein [Clostridium estertheticum]WAG39701.1 hypothetical protein LL065_15615 [Clostridium estertheticum]